MTVSERLFEFKSIGSLTMSKAAWYARMRHVRDYYSGQQCAFAGMTRMWDSNGSEGIKKYSLRHLLHTSLFRLRLYSREPYPPRLQLISSALFILAVRVIPVVGLETVTVQWYAFGVVLVLTVFTYLFTLFIKRSWKAE